MQIIINWLIDHWELVVSVGLFVLSFILQLLKKKPVIDVFHYVYKYLPDAINEAEKTSLKGQEKLFYALRVLIDLLKANNISLSRHDYGQVLCDIENILSTPQKHENK